MARVSSVLNADTLIMPMQIRHLILGNQYRIASLVEVNLAKTEICKKAALIGLKGHRQ